LTSSHVLLASVAAHEITLLLWDLQFSVLLASNSISIPAALSSSTLHIRLLPGSQTQTKTETQVVGQAILILSSIPGKDLTDQKSNSVVLVVPYVVPTTSTVLAAMGKGDASKKWLRAPEENRKPSAEEQVRGKLLATMRTAMQGGRPQAAVAAFMKWAPKPEEVYIHFIFVVMIFYLFVDVIIGNARNTGLQLCQRSLEHHFIYTLSGVKRCFSDRFLYTGHHSLSS